jgi:hypothetical protein
MGLLSYRNGQALGWDREQRHIVPADGAWASRWEKRSQGRGTPNQIAGWPNADAGSAMQPPNYMKLAGPWTNGKDPTEG